MDGICKCCGQTIKKNSKETVNVAEILIPVPKLWVNSKRRPVGIFIKSSDLRLNLMMNKGNPLIIDHKLKAEIADLGGIPSMWANDRGYYFTGYSSVDELQRVLRSRYEVELPEF